MNKVLALLEKHVQWLAIALGALFLVWMGWSYVVKTPVQATIGTAKKVVGPGEVDREIANVPVADLDQKMKSSRSPAIEPVKWVDDFLSRMNFTNVKPALLASSAFPSYSNAVVGSQVLPGGGVPGTDIVQASRLPVLPVPTMHEATAGASNVRPPAAVVAAKPGGDGAVAANDGDAAPAAPKPVIPVAVVPGVDKNWVTVPFSISNKALAKEFGDIKLAALLYRTAFLRVQLIREEQAPDGKWVKQTVVKELSINPLQPMPAANAPKDQQTAYYKWAIEHQPDILQPRFYDVVRGDKWEQPSPDGPTAAAPVAQAPTAVGLPDFDPNKDYLPEEQKQMSPDQRKAYQAAKDKRDKEEREKRAAAARAKRPRGGGGGGKGGGGGGGGASSGGGRVVNDTERPPHDPRDGEDPDDRRGGYRPPPGMPGAGGPPMTPYPSYPGSPYQPGGPAAPAVPVPAKAIGSCPTTEWNPTAAPDDWFGWAFDDTAEAAKVYHYKVVYSIKSPLFAQPKFCKDIALANTFAIYSDKEKTEWTKDVKIPSRTSFYVSKNPQPNSATVQFEVFASQGGTKRNKTFDVAPGDMIGTPEADADFQTGWTLVDLRTDPKEGRVYALLADPNGVLIRRDWFTDKDKPELQTDKQQVNANASAGSAAGAGAANTGG